LILDVNGSFMLALLSEAVPVTVTVTVEGVGASVLFTTASSPPVNAFALVELRRVKAAAFYVAAICVLGLGATSAGVLIADA
jgi:fluoride ion exporter CrcB/FEX